MECNKVRIAQAMKNAKASIEIEGLTISKKAEELVQQRLMGEITEAEFLEKVKNMATGER